MKMQQNNKWSTARRIRYAVASVVVIGLIAVGFRFIPGTWQGLRQFGQPNTSPSTSVNVRAQSEFVIE